MSIYVLGVSAFYHDSAAAIVKDGEIIAAAQEERFSRKKHDPRFPINAINYCLEEAYIEPDELKAVVFYDNPILTFDRVFKTLLSAKSNQLEQWKNVSGSMLGIKLHVDRYIKKALNFDVKVLFTEHHFSHAASAFFPSPFDEAAIVTLDGVGEWATTTIGEGNGRNITIHKEIHFPHSLGLLYSAFTYYCGFKVNSGEYKLMGLAPYGEPVYVDSIKNKLIDLRSDGSFRLNMEYFGYTEGNLMINERFNDLFGDKPRKPETEITLKEMNMAASVQKVIEESILNIAGYAKKLTGKKNIALAGGVALNCVANGKLLKSGIFKNIWIQPAAGDAGGALGAALLASYNNYDVQRKRHDDGRDTQKGSYLGPKFSNNEVQSYLEKNEYPYHNHEDGDNRLEIVAKAISCGKIVGYFSGRMEYGPRALGARSILGDPRSPETQSRMNLKIKYRESFRPFAPTVMFDKAHEYFDIDIESPYMLLVAPVKRQRRKKINPNKYYNSNNDLLKIINQSRSDIPAVTHINYSARIQTINPLDKEDYYRLISIFEQLTGYGVIVNTSFNVRGEPIVCSPHDAYICFMRTEMDILVLEKCILYKEEQPKFSENISWRDEYDLD